MKQFILSFIALALVGLSSAQNVYESPHVFEGKTMQFTLPADYYEVENFQINGNAMFVTQEGLDFDVDNIQEMSLGVLVIMHEHAFDRTLESFMDEVKEGLLDPSEDLTVIAKPGISQVNGRDCMFAAVKGQVNEEKVDALYFSIIRFGDYFVVISYYAMGGVPDVMAYDKFKKIFGSWKEVATDKEDAMEEFEYFTGEDEYDEGMFDDYETNYINDLFETTITYGDILPDYDENWDEPMEENSHLLSEFIYKEEHGSVKVFSGGSVGNYPTLAEMAKAIQTVMELPTRLSLKYDSEFANEDHLLRLYTISGGGTMSSVYTTEVDDEIVFFVVDAGKNPIPDFKPAVRDLMLFMWVDSYDADYEDEEGEYEYEVIEEEE